jgi:hypothetical protein
VWLCNCHPQTEIPLPVTSHIIAPAHARCLTPLCRCLVCSGLRVRVVDVAASLRPRLGELWQTERIFDRFEVAVVRAAAFSANIASPPDTVCRLAG